MEYLVDPVNNKLPESEKTRGGARLPEILGELFFVGKVLFSFSQMKLKNLHFRRKCSYPPDQSVGQ